MTHDTAMLNDTWAYTLIDQLVQKRVDYFCIAPGSRSSSLALAVSRHKEAKLFVHFDERGLGFHALGYGKARKKPCAVIVTSGTAVANLLPSIMEASASSTPMIVLTADRPPELQDNGSNQTIDQVKIFSDFIRWQMDLPCPDTNLPQDFLPSVLSYAVFCSQFPSPGPVHLNCKIREPSFTTSPICPDRISSCLYEMPVFTYSDETLISLADSLSKIREGVIVAGAMPRSDELEAVVLLAERLGWPIFADITSNVRSLGLKSHVIPYFDSILKHRPDIKAQGILHVGGRIVSKTLAEWMAKQKDIPYFHVDTSPHRYDPKLQISRKILMQPTTFCNKILLYLTPSSSSYIDKWKELSNQAKLAIESSLPDSAGAITEISLIKHLQELPSGWNLFLGNSMPIRDADSFFFPSHPTGELFSNRGVSGIDGNIATIAGLAIGSKKPLVAVVGDQTLLHDLNSLAQLKDVSCEVVLIVVNNGGGGIFSFLPIASVSDRFEEIFAAAHDCRFEKIASFFSLDYFSPQTGSDCLNLWEDLKANPKTCLIEITTNRQENVRQHTHIQEEIQKRLCLATACTAN